MSTDVLEVETDVVVYRTIAHRIAENGTATSEDRETIALILERLGKSEEDLQADAAGLAEMRSLRNEGVSFSVEEKRIRAEIQELQTQLAKRMGRVYARSARIAELRQKLSHVL